MANDLKAPHHGRGIRERVVREFCTVYRTFNRRAELKRLCQWAARQRLDDPRRLYERRLADTERLLVRYALCLPCLVRTARLLHRLYQMIWYPPHHLARGSAAAYRFPSTR